MLAPVQPQNATLANEGAWLLLAELNHRVRNEMQVALSALRLAKRQTASAEPARFIEEATLRLEGLGSMCQLLDRQHGQGPLAQRLEALCLAASRAKATPLGVRLALRLDDVTADEETAWTVCVIASELMTNAFKHAFTGGLPGVVGVVLKQDGSGILLTVSDNGVGTQAAARLAKTVSPAPGFGSAIVTQLAARLGGFVTRVSGPDGTTTTFRAPVAARMK
jgi:two-component sensor histidine kinase